MGATKARISDREWDVITRESSYKTMYFGRVLEARRRPLSKGEMNALERRAGKLARTVVEWEMKIGKGARMRQSTVDKRVDEFYASFGLRTRAAS